MTISPTNHVQDTILDALKTSNAVTALVPRLYPSKTPNNPTKPFGRYGSVDAFPSRPSGWRGGDVSGAYHVFVGVSDTISDPTTFCGAATDAIAEAIDSIPDCRVDRTQIIPDSAEPDVLHGTVFFTFTALAEI